MGRLIGGTTELSKGENETELAKHMLEHSQNLKKMVILHSPQQSDVGKITNRSKIIYGHSCLSRKAKRTENKPKQG